MSDSETETDRGATLSSLDEGRLHQTGRSGGYMGGPHFSGGGGCMRLAGGVRQTARRGRGRGTELQPRYMTEI